MSRSAGAVVYEVRRQFREHPGIMDGTETPEYGRVVDICTKDALRELATPACSPCWRPIAVGFTLGVGALGSYLAGAIGAGTLMAVFLANSGGAWDNAKKLVEDGHHGGKGSEAHAATVIGDTVGDPFKDTAGPAINPLLKVMNLVALLIAPAVVKFSYGDDANAGVRVVVAVAGGRRHRRRGVRLQAARHRRGRRRRTRRRGQRRQPSAGRGGVTPGLAGPTGAPWQARGHDATATRCTGGVRRDERVQAPRVRPAAAPVLAGPVRRLRSARRRVQPLAGANGFT